ncbi:MAG: NAD(P)/FAD-dependent oxidoreductase [Anaerococcus sp.]|nr:NAD(P)/FAD-dependent oxidoreductase [Anaerococcus sp.]
MRYDLAIIGAGPGGLSAALNAKIRNKSVIIFGEDSKALSKSKSIKNYLGFKDLSGSDLNEKFKESLTSYDIKFSKERIQTVYAMGSYFALELKDKSMVEATSVIVASGIDLGKGLKGEDKFFANGVNYCATCDAALYRGKDVVVIGYNEESVEEANFTSEIVGSLTYVNMYKKDLDLNENIKLIEGEIPLAFKGEKKAESLVFKSGKEISADGFFIIRDSSKPERLIPSVKLEDGHIKVDRLMQTSIKGLYACGDIVGKPYQIMKAVGEGQIAGLEASKYISKVQRENKEKDKK